MAPRASSFIGQPPALRDLRASEFDDGPGPGALYRGSPGPWWRAATGPLLLAALAGPAVAVLVPVALAPLLGLALLLTLLGRRWEGGAWPLPGPVALVPLALAAWAAVSALWAPDPARALAGAGLLALATLLGGVGAAAVAEERPGIRRALAACAVLGLGAGLVLAHLGPAAAPGPAAAFLALLPPLALRLRLAAPLRWLLLASAAGGAALLPDETARLAALAGAGAALLAGAGGRFASSLLALVLAAALLAAPVLLPRAMPDLARGASAAGLQRLLALDLALERAGRAPLVGRGVEAAGSLPDAGVPPEAAARLGLPADAVPAGRRVPARPGNAAAQVFLELGWIGLGLAALAVLALGWGAGPAGAGMLAAAAVTGLATGAWEPWWLAALAFAGALAAGLSARRV
ncbi:hypothetical protein VQH23_24985 [Pararoseomonas sp. SCSIO 73927]|uniref:hypothetical protein n=1 Tax=Pararoseomonas sp. SCSIO 73927 TaxID=3114537 RepID=UPI0030CC718E